MDLNLDDNPDDVVNAQSDPAQFNPVTQKEYCELLKTNLVDRFWELKECHDDLVDYIEMFKADRVIAEVARVEELLSGKCPVSGCKCYRMVTGRKLESGFLSVSYKIDR